LIFIPNEDWNIVNIELFKIFKHNYCDTSFLINIWDFLILKSFYAYRDDFIYNYKLNWADDLVWANLLELKIKYNWKWMLLARLWYYIWQDKIFISCMQNCKIWRIRYKLKPQREFYEILYKELVSRYNNKGFIMFKNKYHNSNFDLWKFVWNYDKIAKKYWYKKYKDIFWQK
jgi:hypothetical protein